MKQDHFGQSISALRKQKGWTQEELGRKLGVSAQAVSKWETGQAFPDITLLTEIASLFGVSSASASIRCLIITLKPTFMF